MVLEALAYIALGWELTDFATAKDLQRNVDAWIEDIDVNRKEGESPTAYGERGKIHIQEIYKPTIKRLSPLTYLVARHEYRKLDGKMKILEAKELSEKAKVVSETTTTYNETIV